MWASTDALETGSFLPSLYELISPDQMRSYALFLLALMYSMHLDHRHPFVPILTSLGRGAFGCACHGSSIFPCGTARGHRDTVCLFVCATIEPPDGD